MVIIDPAPDTISVTVAGIVMEANAVPVEAMIKVFKDNIFQFQTISDETGEYSLILDAASTYTLVVDQFGYATQVKSIKTLNVPETTADIILVKLGTIIVVYDPAVPAILTGTSGTSVE